MFRTVSNFIGPFLLENLLPNPHQVKKVRFSALLLIASNLTPVVMHIIGQWDLSDSLFLYWIENLIIGFYTVFKIASAQSSETPIRSRSPLINNAATVIGKIPLILFFFVHYTGFCLGHGMFVIMILAASNSTFQNTGVSATELFQRFSLYVYPALFMFLSHGFSFVKNYLGAGEYQHTTPGGAMLSPYKRIAVVHISIFAAFFGAAVLGNGLGVLVGFTFIKTIFDLFSHVKEHTFKDVVVQKSENPQPVIIISESGALLRLIINIVQFGMVVGFFIFVASIFYTVYNAPKTPVPVPSSLRVSPTAHTPTIFQQASITTSQYDLSIQPHQRWHAAQNTDTITIERNEGGALFIVNITEEAACSRATDLIAFAHLFPNSTPMHRAYDEQTGFESWSFGGFETTGVYNVQSARRYPNESGNYCIYVTKYDVTPTDSEIFEMDQIENTLILKVF